MINKDKKNYFGAGEMSQLGMYLPRQRKDLSSNLQSSQKNQLDMVAGNTNHGELEGRDRQIPGRHGPTSLAYLQCSSQIRYLVSNEIRKVP